MRFSVLPSIFALAIFLPNGCTSVTPVSTQAVSSHFLGLQPPGSTPEPFATGIVSTNFWEYGGGLSPDMQEFYVLKERGQDGEMEFVVFRNENGQIVEETISARVGQPFISPDGKTMHLGRRYKVRSDDGWSEIKELGAPFDEYRIMRLTASSSGTYYFDEVGNDGDGRIRFSRLVDGVREEPQLASAAVNNGTWLAHPFIAPDESYILWDGRKEDGYGSSDIYVSFRQEDGSWGEAINLGDRINTDLWEASASVTPDGEYLFFNRNSSADDYDNVDIYWVDASVLDELKPK